MKRAILLADDSPTIQRLVERTFEDSDFAIEAVSNGEAAVQKLEDLAPAAVLADIYMPGKNGYEVCAFVKQHQSLSQTPVVLLVGAFEVFDEDEARRVGADAWITKPFEPKQLTETVAELALKPAPAPEGQRWAVQEESAGASAAAEEATQEGVGVLLEAAPGNVAPESSMPPEASGPSDDTDSEGDLLGLRELFPQASRSDSRRALTEEEVEAIADRVIDRLSAEVVESIAWDIVPEIADRVMRDELKKKD